jgi:hypothetical protein
VVVCGLIVGILFLEETHEDKKDRRDLGLELGGAILGIFRSKGSVAEDSMEKECLIQHEKHPGYSSADSTPRPSSSRSSVSGDSTVCESILSSPASIESEDTIYERERSFPPVKKKLSWRQGFTRQVILSIVGYGVLAL